MAVTPLKMDINERKLFIPYMEYYDNLLQGGWGTKSSPT